MTFFFSSMNKCESVGIYINIYIYIYLTKWEIRQKDSF